MVLYILDLNHYTEASEFLSVNTKHLPNYNYPPELGSISNESGQGLGVLPDQEPQPPKDLQQVKCFPHYIIQTNNYQNGTSIFM